MATPTASCTSPACREEREHLRFLHLRHKRTLREILALFDSEFAKATADLVTAMMELGEKGMEVEEMLDLVNTRKGLVEVMRREVAASAGNLRQMEAVQAAMGGRAFTREEMEAAREQNARWEAGG